SLCEARFAFLSIAKPGAIAPTPASRQGRWVPLIGGSSVFLLCRLVGGLLCWPGEFGAIDPHPMQNDGKLSSDGNFGFAQPASFRKPDAPSLECRPLCYAGEQHIGCLIEVTSQHLIAAFRDAARPIGLARRVSSGRQSDVGANAA